MEKTKEIWDKHFGDVAAVGLGDRRVESFFEALNTACLQEDEERAQKEAAHDRDND